MRTTAAIAFGALLLAASIPAKAQSAYTMTVLNKPSGAVSFVPTSIDQNGVVRGGMYYSAGFLFTNGGIGSCWICPQYLPRDVSWPASTGTSVAATTGTSGFFSVASNNKGTMVGGYEPGSKSFGQGALGELGVRIPNTSWKLLRSVTNVYSGIKRNGTVTPLALPPESATSTYYGFSYTLTGLNNNDVLLGNKTGSSTDNPGRAYTWADGQYTQLDTSVAQPGESIVADAINDSGVVVGHVMTVQSMSTPPSPDSHYPVIWNGGGAARRMGGNELAGFIPVAINTPGQVLLQKVIPPAGNDKTAAAMWFNGSTTTISTLDGREVYPSAMNDSGTVVGCLVQRLLYGGIESAFIWKNGVMQSLDQLASSKGVRLPAGAKLGCPMAINNSGSILTYYYTPSSSGNAASVVRTWIRLNAKP